MAQIIQDSLVITFSRLAKDNEPNPEPAISSDILSALEQVAQELAGSNVIVEIKTA